MMSTNSNGTRDTQAWDDAIGREALQTHQRGELFSGKDKHDQCYDENTWVRSSHEYINLILSTPWHA